MKTEKINGYELKYVVQTIDSHWAGKANLLLTTTSTIMGDGKIVNVHAEMMVSTGDNYSSYEPFNDKHFANMDEALCWLLSETENEVMKELEFKVSQGDRAKKDLEYIKEYGFHF